MARKTKELVVQPEEELNTDTYGPEHYLTDLEDDLEGYEDFVPEEDDDGYVHADDAYAGDDGEASYDEYEYAGDTDGGETPYDAETEPHADDADGGGESYDEYGGEASYDEETEPHADDADGGGSHDEYDGEASYGLGEDDYYDIEEIAEIKEKILERKKEQVIRARNARLRMVSIVVIAVSAVAMFIFSLSDFFTVTYIETEGNEHFTGEEVINIAHAAPGRNIIYDPGKKEMIEYLEQNPYIRTASVSRRLPSTLIIKIREREESFAFRYDDDYLVMDEDGILLRKSRTRPKLTIASGMVVNRIRLGEVTGTEKQAVFEKLLDLMKAVRKGDLYFVTIDISDMTGGGRQVRAYIYDTLVVDADYDMLLDAVKTDKLHFIVSKLMDMGISRGTIRFNEGGTASYRPEF